MVEESNIKRAPGPGMSQAKKRRQLRVEPILVGLIFLWMIVVFGALILATMTANQHAADLLPAVPSPKS
jgi:hypothetical protein